MKKIKTKKCNRDLRWKKCKAHKLWEQLETKTDKVKCNNKENKIVKGESEKSCGLIFPFLGFRWAVHSISFLFERWYKLQKQPSKSLSLLLTFRWTLEKYLLRGLFLVKLRAGGV